VGENPTALRTSRAIQLPLLVPPRAAQLAALESKGVVYTKRWVVELLLDLAGYKSETNLADSVAVEPAAGGSDAVVRNCFCPHKNKLEISKCRRRNFELCNRRAWANLAALQAAVPF